MQDGLTEADAVEWITRANRRWADGHPLFAIVDPDDGRLLGQVGLNVNARHGSAEGHYWVNASDRQRGVALRALGLVADWGFSTGIERLFVVIHPENVASNRLAERMGFTREGILRSHEPVKGERPDLVSWSLLPGDPRPWHRPDASVPVGATPRQDGSVPIAARRLWSARTRRSGRAPADSYNGGWHGLGPPGRPSRAENEGGTAGRRARPARRRGRHPCRMGTMAENRSPRSVPGA